MYYIRHKQTGLYFAGNQSGMPYWRKRPRIYATKGAAKLSMHFPLVNYQWSFLTEEEKQRRIDDQRPEYRRHYGRREFSIGWETRWCENQAKLIYWNTVKDHPLEDLLPPDVELKELTYE